jgi:DNA repair exonuclease SbcCD nuclease subunit
MTLLHTSDWHVGKDVAGDLSRADEHRAEPRLTGCG